MLDTIRQSLLREALEGGVTLIGLTVDQYHDLIDRGTLREDNSTELIDGLIVQKDRAKAGDDPMTIGDRHRMTVLRLARLAPQFEPFGCFLQTQQPIVIPPDDEPEPDVSVIRGTIEDFPDHKPGPPDVIWVLEVADSSLNRDLHTKLRVYAEACVPEYVVINLQDNIIVVNRLPSNGQYAEVVTLRRGDTLALHAGESNRVHVSVSALLG